MTEKKQRAWREAKREVKELTDKLGLPVDSQIIDTVAVLRLLDFATTGSCAGHTYRVTSGPYVIIESPTARKLAASARSINDRDSKEYHALRSKANYFRILDLQRLLHFLDEFYRDRHSSLHHRLIVQSMPMTLNVLQCQGSELAAVGDLKMKRHILQANRDEMKAFTTYLKGKYFSTSRTLASALREEEAT